MSTKIFPGLRRSPTNQFTEKELSWFQEETQENSKRTDVLTECICPGCGETVEKTDIDECIICVQCGEVVERIIDSSA